MTRRPARNGGYVREFWTDEECRPNYIEVEQRNRYASVIYGPRGEIISTIDHDPPVGFVRPDGLGKD